MLRIKHEEESHDISSGRERAVAVCELLFSRLRAFSVVSRVGFIFTVGRPTCDAGPLAD